MNDEKIIIQGSFPTYLKDEIDYLFNTLLLKTKLKSSYTFQVKLCGELLNIPYRVYYDKEEHKKIEKLTDLQKLILNCIYTRHYDGYVREESLKQIVHLCKENLFVIPFVIQLIGEYVIEILFVIKDSLSCFDLKDIKKFFDENPEFYRILQERVTSYWDCYYRWQFPKREDYPGFQILRRINQSNSEVRGI